VPLTILCIATYRKGDEFLRECHRQGCRVLLLTEEKLRDADWPRDSIDAFYYLRRQMPIDDIKKGAAHLARTERIDRIVALDDFDVELAATLREYLFVPGMGETTARAFRDKLAMRRRARSAGIPYPPFVHTLNYAEIATWSGTYAPPWVLKPRSQAAALGIKKLHSSEELWRALDTLGDGQADYLLEKFIAGDVYHVDSIIFGLTVRFAIASRYETPPFVVAHQGGIFVTRTLPQEEKRSVELQQLNAKVLSSFRLLRGVSHTEFIRDHDGNFYFLETSARVGGAYIVDVVEAATGINLWREWARLEIAGEDGAYDPPPARGDSGGIVLSLAKQETPDMSGYTDSEIVIRVKKAHHAGLIVASPSAERVTTLLASYTQRFYDEFHTSAPPPERPTE
jgi:biotin carboxylase